MSADRLRAEKCYNGFYIDEAVGNNAFSFDRRSVKKIYVPPLKSGSVDDLSLGNKIVFAEIEDDVEKCKTGLDYFIHTSFHGTETFIFDNHNHAFFFWALALKMDWIQRGDQLVHVDQHSDMRNPHEWLSYKDIADLNKVFTYTNHILNVGNFIQPALKCGLFSGVDIIDHQDAFENDHDRPFVLDIDVDIFSSEMDYIPEVKKLHTIQHLMHKAKFITIASSPFFIDQKKAINIIQKLFEIG